MDTQDTLDALLGKPLTPRVGDIMSIKFEGREEFKYRITGFKPCFVSRPGGRNHPIPNLSLRDNDHLHYIGGRWETNTAQRVLLSVTLLVRGRGKMMKLGA